MATIVPCQRFRGHTDSVNCIALDSTEKRLLSGGDDATLLAFDTGTPQAELKITSPFHRQPVTSVSFLPRVEHSVVASAGTRVVLLDLRMASGNGECGIVRDANFNKDEINSIAVHPKGSFLAAADDMGEIKVVNLDTWQLHKTLRGGHTSICSSVSFHPRKPWEVFSGGLDSLALRWDFSTGRILHMWDQNSRGATSAQLCNPPFVNSVAVNQLVSGCPDATSAPSSAESAVSSSSEPATSDGDANAPAAERGAKSAPSAAGKGQSNSGMNSNSNCNILAVARGDGAVHIFDADWKEQPKKKSNSSRKPKKEREGGKGEVREEELQGLLAVLGAGCSFSEASSKQCGHHASVSHVALGCFKDRSLLLSGGNDSSLCLWDVSGKLPSVEASSNREPAHLCPMAMVQNKKKVNQVLLGSAHSQILGFVADVSPVVKCYDLDQS